MMISAVIECSFEADFCDWKINSDDHLYKWTRKTIKVLNDNDIPSPADNVNGDYFGAKYIFSSLVLSKREKNLLISLSLYVI